MIGTFAPVGFAVGLAVALVGLTVGWEVFALGVLLLVVSLAVWVRNSGADSGKSPGGSHE